MKEILDFLKELSQNNDRMWFEQNRERYKKIQVKFNEITAKLIEHISDFEPLVRGLSVSDCAYRIYRDTRFSPDKTPYKTHIGAYICPAGKKSGYAGYYLHVEPDAKSILAAGLHCPEPNVVKSVREEIFTNGAQFESSINHADGFILDECSKLKRPPRGYAATEQYVEYLKLKEYDLIKPISEQELMDADLLSNLRAQFLKCKPFNDILNRAVEYAKSETL